MPIITLTTDFGLKDYYVSAVKGKIMSLAPTVQIIDITHQIPAYDILAASLNLKNAYKNFPKGTIHIADVGSASANTIRYLIALHQEQFFIAADNNLLPLVLDGIPEKIYEIDTGGKTFTFPARDVFAHAACFIANGGAIDGFKTLNSPVNSKSMLHASGIGDMIKGNVVYIDGYGNGITNIHKELFLSVGKNRPFVINFPPDRVIKKISNNYSDEPGGELMALFNAENYLEIAQSHGSPETKYGLIDNLQITIQFL